MKFLSNMLMVVLVMSLVSLSASAKERNEGVRCLKKHKTYTAVWDEHKWGRVRQERVKVASNWGGGYSCMGKCGAGCKNKKGGYAKDCLDHDVCSKRKRAKAGPFSWHCGDEWNHAADDYIRAGRSCPR